jgi:hypothetical protein
MMQSFTLSLQGPLERVRRTGVGKCRVGGVPDPNGSGVGKGSGKTKVKNRARKAITQIELRQCRQQFLGAKQSKQKSWVDNNVYYLVDMRKTPPKKRSRVDGLLQ